jgi:hypothetical protein
MTTIKREEFMPPMIQKINWKGVLCQFLDIDDADNETILESLHTMKHKLNRINQLEIMGATIESAEEITYQIIHRVSCSDEGTVMLYSERPWVVKNAKGWPHLRGSGPIENLDLHLERHKEKAFLVYNDYACCQDRRSPFEQDQLLAIVGENPLGLLLKESVSIIDEKFSFAMKEIFSKIGSDIHPNLVVKKEFAAPYVWWYVQRDMIQVAAGEISSDALKYIQLFQDYIDASLGQEYNAVDRLLAEDMIKPKYMHYLYVRSNLTYITHTLNWDQLMLS